MEQIESQHPQRRLGELTPRRAGLGFKKGQLMEIPHKLEINPEDIKRVTEWMLKWACGYKNARNRKDIENCLMMEDRYFRTVCAEIPEIITSSKGGYWILPSIDPSGDEIRHAREIAMGEDRRRIISLYLRHRRQREAIQRLADSREGELF